MKKLSLILLVLLSSVCGERGQNHTLHCKKPCAAQSSRISTTRLCSAHGSLASRISGGGTSVHVARLVRSARYKRRARGCGARVPSSLRGGGPYEYNGPAARYLQTFRVWDTGGHGDWSPPRFTWSSEEEVVEGAPIRDTPQERKLGRKVVVEVEDDDEALLSEARGTRKKEKSESEYDSGNMDDFLKDVQQGEDLDMAEGFVQDNVDHIARKKRSKQIKAQAAASRKGDAPSLAGMGILQEDMGQLAVMGKHPRLQQQSENWRTSELFGQKYDAYIPEFDPRLQGQDALPLPPSPPDGLAPPPPPEGLPAPPAPMGLPDAVSSDDPDALPYWSRPMLSEERLKELALLPALKPTGLQERAVGEGVVKLLEGSTPQALEGGERSLYVEGGMEGGLVEVEPAPVPRDLEREQIKHYVEVGEMRLSNVTRAAQDALTVPQLAVTALRIPEDGGDGNAVELRAAGFPTSFASTKDVTQPAAGMGINPTAIQDEVFTATSRIAPEFQTRQYLNRAGGSSRPLEADPWYRPWANFKDKPSKEWTMPGDEPEARTGPGPAGPREGAGAQEEYHGLMSGRRRGTLMTEDNENAFKQNYVHVLGAPRWVQDRYVPGGESRGGKEQEQLMVTGKADAAASKQTDMVVSAKDGANTALDRFGGIRKGSSWRGGARGRGRGAGGWRGRGAGGWRGRGAGGWGGGRGAPREAFPHARRGQGTVGDRGLSFE